MEIKRLTLLDSTARWQFAMAILLVIGMAALFVYEHKKQAEALYSPQIINMAGKQRMLSQRVSYLQHLVVSQPNAQEKSSWQAEMRLLLDEFDRSHQVLNGSMPIHENRTVRLSQPLRSLFIDGENSLNNDVATFLSVNRDISNANGQYIGSFYPPQQGTVLLAKLDDAVSFFEQQSKALNQHLSMVLTAIWLLGLGLLVILIRLFTRPFKLTIEEQHTAQIQTKNELVTTKEELENQIEQRSVYISKIAHDLRSPVSAIISVLDLLPNSRGESQSLLRQAEMACQRLLKYTDDLTDVIKPTADKGVQRPFNLVALLDDSLAKTANACELKNINFVVNNQSDIPEHVLGYPRVIRKCLENVLHNAVMYTKEGQVTVDLKFEVEASNISMMVAITDTGSGIPNHHLDLIFERFKRLPSNRNENESMTGVGLAITRECIEAINGSISVLSHVGHGSTFTMQFPLSKAIATEDIEPEAPSANNEGVRFAIIDDFEISRKHLQQLVELAGYQCDLYSSSTDFFEQKQHIAEYAGLIIDYYMPGLNGEELVLTLNAMLGSSMPPVIMVSSSPDIANIVANSSIKAWQVFTKPIMENRFVDAVQQLVSDAGADLADMYGTILLVEDEKVNAEMMVHMLTNMGYMTKVAPDGETCLSLVHAFAFDCILLDIHLPDMDGLTLIEKLNAKGIDLPVIVISGDTADKTEMMAIEAGVRYYLYKPVPFQELRNTLKLTLSKANKRQSMTSV